MNIKPVGYTRMWLKSQNTISRDFKNLYETVKIPKKDIEFKPYLN